MMPFTDEDIKRLVDEYEGFVSGRSCLRLDDDIELLLARLEAAEKVSEYCQEDPAWFDARMNWRRASGKEIDLYDKGTK